MQPMMLEKQRPQMVNVRAVSVPKLSGFTGDV
jgi:hypothetical protein